MRYPRFSLALMLSALMVVPLWARVIHVPAEDSTIQDGINHAVIGDTVLVASGTYFEHLNYSGKNILVKSESGPEVTIIQRAVVNLPLVSFTNGESEEAILDGFTVTGSLNAPGVRISNSSATLRNNIFIGNVDNADGGAVAALYGGVLSVFNNIFRENSSIGGTGGAIRTYGIKLVAVGNEFINNFAGQEGAIHLRANSTSDVHHNLFLGNHGDRMGAMILSECDGGVFYNNTLVANTSGDSRYPGGIVIWMSHNLHIFNNIIVNNTPKGIYAYSSSNCALTYNDVWNNQINYDGITPGEGSISADPFFVGGEPCSYELGGDSPCIDAGDPNSPNDPDGSRADMGAYYSHQGEQGLTFKIPDVYGSQGNVVDVPILAMGFNSHAIGGFEFHMTYDDECLAFENIQSDYFLDAAINVNDGQIHMVWEDITTPLDLPDSAALFTIQFTVNGPLDSTCPITWQENNQVVDPGGEPYAHIGFDGGGVTVAVLYGIGDRIVYYGNSAAIPGVAVSLDGSIQRHGETSDNGYIDFENLIPGHYELCPTLARNDSGVTVADIIKIRRHIVHLESFDSPYKLIAADVNNSGTVTVADAVKVRRYLANLENLPSGNWTFVDQSFAINDSNWTQAPHCLDIDLLNQDILDLATIGIRMGDVDASWSNPRLISGTLTDTVSLELSSSYGMPGDQVTLSILGHGIIDVAGIEMHLSYPVNGLSLINVNSNILTEPTVNAGNGEIHLVWEDIYNPVTISDGGLLLTIIFQIQENAPDPMNISFSAAHAADETGDEWHVITGNGQIRLGPTDVGDGNKTLPTTFSLAQNYPNPFNAETKIGFTLPKASAVNLEVIDLMGRKVSTLQSGHLDAGTYNLTWNGRADNGKPLASGVYFYRLKTDSFNETKRMLMLK